MSDVREQIAEIIDDYAINFKDALVSEPVERILTTPIAQTTCPECKGKGLRFLRGASGMPESYRYDESTPCPKCKGDGKGLPVTIQDAIEYWIDKEK